MAVAVKEVTGAAGAGALKEVATEARANSEMVAGHQARAAMVLVMAVAAEAVAAAAWKSWSHKRRSHTCARVVSGLKPADYATTAGRSKVAAEGPAAAWVSVAAAPSSGS